MAFHALTALRMTLLDSALTKMRECTDMKKIVSLIAMLAAGALAAGSAQAAGNIECHLDYSMSGWSLFYKTASGTGTVTCDNGTRIPVKIGLKGGGLTVGKSKIVDGKGRFSGAYTVDDLFGTYAAVGAHAGAARSSDVTAMTKGDISLALAGTGEGWNLGVDGAAFTIQRR